MLAYLTQKQINNMKDHGQGEFCREESQKPLRGVHVSLNVQLVQMRIKIRNVILKTTTIRHTVTDISSTVESGRQPPGAI